MIFYTDGSCFPNPGPGGWAWVALTGNRVPIAHWSGHEPETTNNLMEMQAVLEAMRFAQKRKETRLGIYADSQYIVKGMDSWTTTWQNNGWVNWGGKPVRNKDVWLELLHLRKQFRQVNFHWVRGHEGHQWNEWADRLAGQARSNGKEKASISWSEACTDAFKELKDSPYIDLRRIWSMCSQCRELPRIWSFDNGEYVTCRCSHDKFRGFRIRVESILSHAARRTAGEPLEDYDGVEALRKAWNRFAVSGVYPDPLPKGQW